MTDYSNIYWCNNTWNTSNTPVHVHKATEFKYHEHEDTKGCCQFIREGYYDILHAIEYNVLPDINLITKFTGFTTHKEYITWWINLINSLDTFKIIMHPDADKKFYFAEMKAAVHPLRFQMLYGFTLLRYLRSVNTYTIPLYTYKLLELYPDIELPNILAIACFLCNNRDRYGDIYPDATYGISLKYLKKEYDKADNGSVYKRSGGYDKSINWDVYKTNIRPIFEDSIDISLDINTITNTIKDKVDRFLLVWDKIKLINTSVVLNRNLPISNIVPDKKYKINNIDVHKKFASIYLVTSDYKLNKFPLTIFKQV